MEKSLRNTEEMWRQGVPAVPYYHVGEPEEALYHIAKAYPKIALGGMVGVAASQDAKWSWLEQCFARVWPKRIHGFGVSAERMVYGLPFHSVDATNWEIGPCAFGNWQKFGAMSVRGSSQDLRSQVKFYLDMESKARVRWAREMAQLDALPDKWPQRPAPSVRLALAIERDTGNLYNGERVAFSPSVRLVAGAHQSRDDAKIQAFAARMSKAPSKPTVPKSATGELDDRWKGNWWE